MGCSNTHSTLQSTMSDTLSTHIVPPGSRWQKAVGRPRARRALKIAYMAGLLAAACSTSGISGGDSFVLPLAALSAFAVIVAAIFRLCEKPREILIRTREPTSSGPVFHLASTDCDTNEEILGIVDARGELEPVVQSSTRLPKCASTHLKP